MTVKYLALGSDVAGVVEAVGRVAKHFGSTITGVDAARKLATISAAGADHVIDYREHWGSVPKWKPNDPAETESLTTPEALLAARRQPGAHEHALERGECAELEHRHSRPTCDEATGEHGHQCNADEDDGDQRPLV